MSNVLIGIIGVILFIGLALAGALFLGPRFQEATSASKASSTIQAVQQTTNALRMFELQEGRNLSAANYITNMQTLITAGYLTAAPANGVNAGGIITVNAQGGGSGTTDHVYTSLGDGTTARSVCAAIERQATGTEPSLAPIANWGGYVASHRRVGCFLQDGTYYAYGAL